MSDLDHLSGLSAEDIFRLDWYERTIEPEVRDFVRLLRNNGFNTTGSCGHERWVVVAFFRPFEVGDLLVFLHEQKQLNFKLEVSHRCDAYPKVLLAKITLVVD